MRAAIVGAIGGAVAVYFLDPSRGRARRHALRDRSMAALRHRARRVARELRVRTAVARGHAHGLLRRLGRAPARELDDATLAHKVESILFRDARVPKGRISINAERGAVFLRGELESLDLIRELENAVREISGVRTVENLLHLPGTPAPHPRGGVLLGRADSGG
jgi:osmotically-inducible protein OsmY